MSTTKVTRHLRASRPTVWRALVDPEAVTHWKAPAGMTCLVQEFDGREGGSFRITLTYEAADAVGKTTPHSDTYHGRFATLVPNERLVEVDEFETDDPALRGAMTITITLTDADGGTDLVAEHEGLPPGIAPADNELGWRESLDRLADLVETP